jgi:hypothetical protein
MMTRGARKYYSRDSAEEPARGAGEVARRDCDRALLVVGPTRTDLNESNSMGTEAFEMIGYG